MKSRCAGEWGGWGRLSEDGPGQHNPDPSEGPWGGGRPTLQGGASSGRRPGAVRDNRPDPEVHEGRRQTGRQQAYAGSRLKPLTSGKAPPDRPAFQPYWGKPAVRNERGDRGNVGIIRSPVRASILPDHGCAVLWCAPGRVLPLRPRPQSLLPLARSWLKVLHLCGLQCKPLRLPCRLRLRSLIWTAG